MFSRNSVFRQPTSRAKAASISDPLTSSSQGVVGAISHMSPAADDSLVRGQRAVSGRHEVLRDLKSSPIVRLSPASSTASFPSTGLSRSRKASAPVLQTTTQSQEPNSAVQTTNTSEEPGSAVQPIPSTGQEPTSVHITPDVGRESVDAQTIDDKEAMTLPHDSLGRRVWLHFQAAPEQSDLRDMVAGNPNAVLVLPVSAHTGDSDFTALLNDNVLFTEHPLLDASEPTASMDTKCKFTTVSGICGTIDAGSVSALGVLPPMEELMQAVGKSDSPHTTLFDVLDANMPGPPLQRLRITHRPEGWRLPDTRSVQVVVTSSPLERRLVVDSAVTTLSARIYDAVDATFGALLPQAPELLSANDQTKVDIEEIMQFAHTVELRAHSSHSAKDASASRKALAWIAGQKSAKSGSPHEPAHSGLTSESVDAVAKSWQLCLSRFQDHIMEYLAKLEDETSVCGDIESRRKICTGLLECVEKLTTEALYPCIFSPSFSDDRMQDEQIASKIAALNMAGITLEHLGLVKPLAANSDLLRICNEAGRLLDRVDSMRSPAEKLKLIVDAHKCVVDRMQTLNRRLKRMQKTEGTSDDGEALEPPAELSADSILPLLIFSVVKSNPSRFISNLRFIQRFRAQSLLASEFEYCMTNAQAAASFVSSVDARTLGLSAEVSSSALDCAMPPALTALHNLFVNNVVSSVGIDVVQGVAGGGKKVAVNVYDATLGRLFDSSSQLISKARWRSPEDRELQSGTAGQGFGHLGGGDEQSQVILGVQDVLANASRQLSYEIKGHLPRSANHMAWQSRMSPAQPPQIIDRFMDASVDDLKMSDISQLLSSYKDLARYISE
ncbi:hypothetical protein GGH19_003562 [Coemansia sp. RSA 1807]|nr:hypothetical protein GGF48_000937 [Coemansia sp. RSA 921]KAJ2281378.1 hypothetical protein EV176_000485 [Coemansia sp. RSA 451]KAJ2533514.1 hypothetical protein GGH20_000602 [Coemansia sp. RSA 1937]KAJ2574746.1 hypothetical protein GGH19_003562 [Coemansia sp. RSA 1807]